MKKNFLVRFEIISSISGKLKHANRILFIQVLEVACKYSLSIIKHEIFLIMINFSFTGINDITSQAPVCHEIFSLVVHLTFILFSF